MSAPTSCQSCGETIRNPSPEKHVCDACVGLASEGHYINDAICRGCGATMKELDGGSLCPLCRVDESDILLPRWLVEAVLEDMRRCRFMLEQQFGRVDAITKRIEAVDRILNTT